MRARELSFGLLGVLALLRETDLLLADVLLFADLGVRMRLNAIFLLILLFTDLDREVLLDVMRVLIEPLRRAAELLRLVDTLDDIDTLLDDFGVLLRPLLAGVRDRLLETDLLRETDRSATFLRLRAGLIPISLSRFVFISFL